MQSGSASPRLEGIEEQFERAKLFFEEARAATDYLFRFRHLVAATYFARAIVELMLEAAEKQEVSQSRDEVEKLLSTKLPRYFLVERMRIHDFHRFGLLPRPGVFVGGPIKVKLRGKGSLAAIAITQHGIKKSIRRDAEIDEQRPLNTKDGQVLDDEAGQYISIEQVLSDYLEAVPAALEAFKELMAKPHTHNTA